MNHNGDREPLVGRNENADVSKQVDAENDKRGRNNVSVKRDVISSTEVHGSKNLENNKSSDSKPVEKKGKGGRALPAIDGGWGWMCVVGCCLMHFILGGFGRSFGIIYVKMLGRFECSAATGSTIGGVFTSVRMGCGPLISVLIKRFSVRSVTAVGALVFATGSLLCAFALSPLHMFITYSLLSGIGGAMVYFPAIVVVGEYFDKRRGIAMGLSTAGSGLGCMLFPPIYQFLFDTYGFGGTFVIVSGMILNFLVCSALYRPLAETWRGINLALRKKVRLDKEANDRPPLLNGDLRTMIEVSSNGNSDISQNGQLNTNRSVTGIVIDTNYETGHFANGSAKMYTDIGNSSENTNNVDVSHPNNETTSTGNSTARRFTDRQLSAPNPYQPYSEIARGEENAGKSVKKVRSNSNPGASYGTEERSSWTDSVEVRYFRDTLQRAGRSESDRLNTAVYSGADITHVPPNNNDADETIAATEDRPLIPSLERRKSVVETTWQKIDSYLGFSLLANPAFSCFVIASGLGTMAYISAQNLIVAHANDIGIDPNQSVYVLSTIGIADTLGRVLSGVLFDVPLIRRVRSILYAFILLGSGLSIIGWAFCTDFAEVLALSLANGAFNGAIVTGRPITCADLVGIENMSQAFGMTVFSQGVFIIIGPYIAGYLKDITGTYVMTYIFSGASSCVAAVLYLIGNRVGPNARCCTC